MDAAQYGPTDYDVRETIRLAFGGHRNTRRLSDDEELSRKIDEILQRIGASFTDQN